MPKESKKMDTIDIIGAYADGEEKMRVVADRMGIPYSTLMRKLNPHDAYQVNATEIIPLVLATGNQSLIEHYCERLNIVAVPMGDSQCGGLDVHALARFAKEAGEAMAAMSGAIKDARITAAERRECKQELMELVQTAWALLKSLEE